MKVHFYSFLGRNLFLVLQMQTLLDKKEKTTSSVGEDTGDSIKKESSSDMEMKSLATKRKDHRARNTPPLITSDEIILEKDGHNGRLTRTLQEGVVAGERLESTSKSGDPLWSGLSLDVGQVIRRPYIWLFMAMQASCVLTGVAFLGSYKVRLCCSVLFFFFVKKLMIANISSHLHY